MKLPNKDKPLAEQIHSDLVEIKEILSIEKNNPASPLYKSLTKDNLSSSFDDSLHDSVFLMYSLNRLRVLNYGKSYQVDKVFHLINSIAHMLIPEKGDVESVIHNIVEFCVIGKGCVSHAILVSGRYISIDSYIDELTERLCSFIFPTLSGKRGRFFDWLKFAFKYLDPLSIDLLMCSLEPIISQLQLTESDRELSRAFLEGVKTTKYFLTVTLTK